MDPEEVLKKHIEGKQAVEEGKLFAAASLVSANKTKELVDASMLLAKTTQASAELLAKTTQASAELLAKTTQASAEQLGKSNETSAELLAKTTQTSAELLAKTTEDSDVRRNKTSEIAVRWMKWLTIVLVALGVVQIAIAVTSLFVSLRAR